MTRDRPETRARAVLALLDPWLKRVDLGPEFGDVDLARSRTRLASIVRRVRAVAVRGQHPDLESLTIQSHAPSRHAAIDALLTFARGAKVGGISPAEVDAMTNEIAGREDAALEEATQFMNRLRKSLPRRTTRTSPRWSRLRLVPPDGPTSEPLTPDEARAMTDRVMGAS